MVWAIIRIYFGTVTDVDRKPVDYVTEMLRDGRGNNPSEIIT